MESGSSIVWPLAAIMAVTKISQGSMTLPKSSHFSIIPLEKCNFSVLQKLRSSRTHLETLVRTVWKFAKAVVVFRDFLDMIVRKKSEWAIYWPIMCTSGNNNVFISKEKVLWSACLENVTHRLKLSGNPKENRGCAAQRPFFRKKVNKVKSNDSSENMKLNFYEKWLEDQLQQEWINHRNVLHATDFWWKHLSPSQIRMKHDFYIFAKAANMFIFGKQFENWGKS